MAKCPCCENEMKKGFVEGDGRQPLIWVEEDEKRSFVQNIIDDKCIVLQKKNLLGKTRVISHYCGECKKIIIEVK